MKDAWKDVCNELTCRGLRHDRAIDAFDDWSLIASQ